MKCSDIHWTKGKIMRNGEGIESKSLSCKSKNLLGSNTLC